MGGPVTGVLKLTSGDYKNTHLSAWKPTTFAEWKLASPESFFHEGLQFPTDALYKLPSLGFKHLPNNNGWMAKLLFIPDKARVHVEAAALPLPKPLVPRVNGVHPVPPPPTEPKATPPVKAKKGDPFLLFVIALFFSYRGIPLIKLPFPVLRSHTAFPNLGLLDSPPKLEPAASSTPPPAPVCNVNNAYLQELITYKKLKR